jgi:hypothetical protein
VFEDVFNLKGKTVEDLASEFSKWVKVRREEKQNKEKQGKQEIIRQRENGTRHIRSLSSERSKNSTLEKPP